MFGLGTQAPTSYYRSWMRRTETNGRPRSRVLAASLPGHDLAVLAAWAVGGLLASVRLFRWEPRASR